ncbi:MAG: AzlD domain-containing protein [Clostridia bacterium]|nr:AzlD domain-containing protein [Clostridia bacterium]
MFRTEGFLIALLIMAVTTYLIRLLPILFVRRRIKSVFIRSFLHYVPFVVLTAISFPAIIFSTGNVISGVVATVACVILAYRNMGIITVSIGGVGAALITELLLLLVK